MKLLNYPNFSSLSFEIQIKSKNEVNNYLIGNEDYYGGAWYWKIFMMTLLSFKHVELGSRLILWLLVFHSVTFPLASKIASNSVSKTLGYSEIILRKYKKSVTKFI